MNAGLLQIAVLTGMTVAFFSGGVLLKQFSVSSDVTHIILSFAAYAIGNVLLLSLIVDSGLARAMTFSSAAQISLSTLVAVFWFGEKLSVGQGCAIVIAISACVYLMAPTSNA